MKTRNVTVAETSTTKDPLDVFVIAILIVSARMDGITEPQLLSGLYYFIVSVLLVNAVSPIFTWALGAAASRLRRLFTAG